METGSITKPVAVAPAAPRAETMVSSGAVKTDLTPEAAVQQVGAAQAARFEPSRGVEARAAVDAAVREMISHNVIIDRKTREVVFQTVDERTGEVVRQIPDDTMLRLRAYAREMREKDVAESTNIVEKIA
jgi:uncharacterized FlaG/YvyC family protein